MPGKMTNSILRPPFRPPQVPAAVRSSRLSCGKVGKAQIFTSARESSGESRLMGTEPLSNLRGSIPLPFVTTFLTVALDEGKGVCAYARAMGMHRAKASRYLRAIGDRASNGGPGLEFVTVARHPSHPQRHQIFLSTKGSVIAEEIFRQMRRAKDSEISILNLSRGGLVD
jgi:hypothetical protein